MLVELSDLRMSWFIKTEIESLEEQNDSLTSEMNYKLSYENDQHKSNIESIKKQYGM